MTRICKLLIFIIFIELIVLSMFRFNIGTFPEKYEINNFPLIQQPDGISCGATSATMLLKWFRKDLTVEDAKKLGKTKWFTYDGNEIGMTSPDYIPVILSHYNVKSTLRVGNLNTIKYYISQERPPIILLRSGEISWHYMVGIKYDLTSITFADPGDSTEFILSNKDFLNAWNFSGDMNGNTMKTPDYLRMLLRLVDVHENLMIVPQKK